MNIQRSHWHRGSRTLKSELLESIGLAIVTMSFAACGGTTSEISSSRDFGGSGAASGAVGASGGNRPSGGSPGSGGIQANGGVRAKGGAGGGGVPSVDASTESGASRSTGGRSSGGAPSSGGSADSGESCDSSTCIVGAAMACCGGSCVNIRNDPHHCGSCDNSCPGSAPYCSSAQCGVPPCTPNPAGGVCAPASICCGRSCCAPGLICCSVYLGGPAELTDCYDPSQTGGTCPVGCPTCQ